MVPGTRDFDADLAWAYNNIYAPVTKADAPSGTAWFLRRFDRREKTMGAFVTMCNKALSKKTNDTEDTILRDDRRRQFALLHTLAEGLGITLKPTAQETSETSL